MFPIPQSTSFVAVFKAYLSSDHVSEATGKTIAITISKAGGAFGNPNAGATNATEISGGWYKVTLDTTDTATLGIIALRGTSSGVDDIGDRFFVVSASTGGLTNLDAAVSTRLATSGYTAPSNLTATQIATGVWQDATAGDFTAAGSIGKSVMNGVALGTGLTVNDITTKTGYALSQTFPANFSSLSIDGSGRLDVAKIAGTAQTARDIGASVLLSTGTGTGQLDFTSGVVKANLAQILGTALTETAGQIAGAFKKFFNIGTPASTMDALTLVATATNLTNAPTSGDLTATMKTSVTTAATAATPTAAAVAGAVGSVTGNVGGSVGSISGITFPTHFSSMAIDVSGAVTFNNTGIATVTNLTNAPTAGDFTAAMKTSLNAATPASIVGAVGSVTGLTASDVGAIKAKTDNLPAAPADESLIIAATNSLASSIAALPTTTTVNAIKAKTDNLPASPAATGDAMTLTGAYDAAKTAATQSSVDDVPTNAELATALAGTDDATLAAIAALSIPTAAAVRAEMDSNSTRLAHLDADISSRSTFAGGAVASVTGAVGSVTGLTASDVGAIKAKTDNLPASPAAVGSAMTLTGAYDAAKAAASQASVDDLPTNAELATALGTADDATLAAIAALPTSATVDAIKVQTDKLTFSKANELDANIHSVNGVGVVGLGSSGSPWGPG